MRPEDCPRFDSCSAPICPLAGDGDIWYADEPICSLQEFCHSDWIKNQHKIAKITRDLDTYYTLRMLQRNCIIGKGISGLDPDETDIDDERAVTNWLKKHPEKKEISAERKEIIRNLGESYRQGSTSFEKDQSAKEINGKESSLSSNLSETIPNHTKVPIDPMRVDIYDKNPL
jgi:hypothetical protein